MLFGKGISSAVYGVELIQLFLSIAAMSGVFDDPLTGHTRFATDTRFTSSPCLTTDTRDATDAGLTTSTSDTSEARFATGTCHAA